MWSASDRNQGRGEFRLEKRRGERVLAVLQRLKHGQALRLRPEHVVRGRGQPAAETVVVVQLMQRPSVLLHEPVEEMAVVRELVVDEGRRHGLEEQAR